MQDTVNIIDKCSVQFECLSKNKFVAIEQSRPNVKEELNVAISQKYNNVTERVVIT